MSPRLSVAGAEFWLADESPEHENFSPESLGGSTVRLLLVVDDPHTVVERAVALGARQVAAVEPQHDWLLGRIEDPFGHHWHVSTHQEDVSPDEMARRAAAASKPS